MSHVASPALDARAESQVRSARSSGRDAPGRRSRRDEISLDHYLRRLDPEVAASFNDEQREAIKTLLGARGVARHTVEVRRSIPFGRRRFYLVLLFGPEHRALARLYSKGMVSARFTILFYLGLGTLFLAPVLTLLYAVGR